MSSRLNQEREKKLQPERMKVATQKLEAMGYIVTSDDTALYFEFKGATVKYFAYSGWATGATIKDGRGLNNLINQL